MFSVTSEAIPLRAKQPKPGSVCWLVYTDVPREKSTAGRDHVNIGLYQFDDGWRFRVNACIGAVAPGVGSVATINSEPFRTIEEAERAAVASARGVITAANHAGIRQRGRLLQLLETGQCQVSEANF